MGGLHSSSSCQVTADTTVNDFNSGEFKTRMKEMAAQAYFYLSQNAFLPLEQYGPPKIDSCVPNKGGYHSVNFSGPSKNQEAVIIRLRHTAIN